MTEIQVNLTGRQWLQLGLLFVAVVLAVVAMFTPWWTLTSKVNITGGSFPVTGSASVDARPYSQGNFDGAGDDLGTEVVVTGILYTFGLVALLGFVASQAMRTVGRPLAGPLGTATLVGAVVIGVASLAYTAVAWPLGYEPTDASDIGFWDSASMSVPGGSVRMSAAAALGWYLAAVATVVLPVVLFVLGRRTHGEPTLPPAPAVAAPVVPGVMEMAAPAPVAMPTGSPAAPAGPKRVRVVRRAKE